MNSCNWLGIALICINQTSVFRSPATSFKNSEKVYSSQSWGLSEKFGANVFKAWKYTQGNPEILIAVIDTGMDVFHSSLKKSLYINDGEKGIDKNGKNKETNGIDDDGDGLIDNVHGWDFVREVNDLKDNHGHGTHIAGIIAGSEDMDVKFSGVAPNVKIMPLKYYDPKVPNTDNLKNTVKSLKFAVKKKVKIINYSGGGTEFSQEEHDAIAEAAKQNILVVVAAGNERSDLDSKAKYYPCAYNLPNIICVGSMDEHKNKLPSSNWGKLVDVFAPGQSILSTIPGGSFGYMTGTSQATAFVSGQAALILSENGSLTPPEVKKIILETVTIDEKLKKICKSGGFVDVEKSVFTARKSEESISTLVEADSKYPRKNLEIDFYSREVAEESKIDVKEYINHKKRKATKN